MAGQGHSVVGSGGMEKKEEEKGAEFPIPHPKTCPQDDKKTALQAPPLKGSATFHGHHSREQGFTTFGRH